MTTFLPENMVKIAIYIGKTDEGARRVRAGFPCILMYLNAIVLRQWKMCDGLENTEEFPGSATSSQSFRRLVVRPNMVEVMHSPFRYNKKERKRLRGHAKKHAIAADKFEREDTKPDAVAVLRRLASFSSRMALAKRVAENPKTS